jgi:alanine racemase
MVNRAQPGSLRRELRFSKGAIEANLSNLSLELDAVKPMLEACMTNNGLLGLYGSELLLLEKALGFRNGISAVSLVGELVSVKKVPEKTGVSYGYLAETAASTNLGLVAIGFSDGIPRKATNAISIEVAGTRFPQIGRIAMDQCVLDLGPVKPAIGSEAIFFDQNYTLGEFADSLTMSPLEVLGRITNRVARVWN